MASELNSSLRKTDKKMVAAFDKGQEMKNPGLT
jgi:hypothetical protein